MFNYVIQNAKYVKDPLTGENCGVNCVINGQHMSVPLDKQNTDYAAILEWVAEGNTIQDAD